jgi:hypothetical protein
MSSYTQATEHDIEQMLAVIGVATVGELFADIPKEVMFDRALDLPAGKPEQQVYAELAALAAAGGQRFAGAMAAGTPPISQAGGNSTEDMSKLTSTLAETLLPTGDTGLGIALPILLIGSLIGGIAIAGSRKKSARS